MEKMNWLEIKFRNPVAFKKIIDCLCPVAANGFINFWYVSMDGELRLCHKDSNGCIVHQHGVTLGELSSVMPNVNEFVKQEIYKLNDKMICSLE